MADDTRQPQLPQSDPSEQLEYKRPRKPKPKHDFPQTQAGKMWDALGNPENPVNSMPGGTYNSAGGKPREVSWRDAFNFDLMKTERPAFYQTGCGRDSLLVGIGAGGAVGGLSFILRGLSSMLMTSNYAVGTFTLTAGGMYYWCIARQKEEAKGMAVAVAGMKMLNEKKAREIAEAEAATRQAEEQQKLKRSSWKFW